MGACNCTSISPARSFASSLGDYCNEQRRESVGSCISNISNNNKRELSIANLSVSTHSSLFGDEPSSKLLSPPLTPTKVPNSDISPTKLRSQSDYHSVGNLAEMNKCSILLTPQMARHPRRNSYGEKNPRERKDICIFVTEAEPVVSFSSGKHSQNNSWVADFDQPQVLGKSREEIVSNGKPLNSSSNCKSTANRSLSGKTIRGMGLALYVIYYFIFPPKIIQTTL